MSARTPSRRDVLKAAGSLAALRLASPIAFRSGTAHAAVDPASADRYRLVVINLSGGNDGLNTVVPQSGDLRLVYDKVRGAGTNLPASSLRALGATDGGTVGLNDNLKVLHQLWQQDRVAVVQGVDYDDPNYSHFIADDIWQSGVRERSPKSGWLGRHLDRVGIPAGELRGIGTGTSTLPLSLYGLSAMGEQVGSLGETQFADGSATAGAAGKRHAAFAGYDAEVLGAGVPYGDTCASAYRLAAGAAGLTAASPGGLSNALLTTRTLLGANLGVEVVQVTTGGYDTHDKQLTAHAALMRSLDLAIEAFYYGTHDGNPILYGGTAGDPLTGKVAVPGTPIGPLSPHLAARTLIVTFSEFGRRIGDNGFGTDHGAAGPMFLIGPPPAAPGSGTPRLTPGLHRRHPSMGSTLLPADNLAPTTDFRSVYQSVLTGWLGTAGDAAFRREHLKLVDDGVALDGTLAGLFGTA